MDILLVAHRYPPEFIGGAEMHVKTLASSLAAAGAKVTVLTGGKRKVVYEGRVKVVRVPEFLVASRMATLGRLLKRKLVRKRVRKLVEKADIVHIFDHEGVVIFSGWEAIGRKLVATIQDYHLVSGDGKGLFLVPERKVSLQRFWDTPEMRTSLLFKKPYLLLAYLFRYLVRGKSAEKLENVIFVSNFIAQVTGPVFKKVRRKKVISNALEEGWTTKKVRQDIDVLYVGRVEEYKGIGVLGEAWKKTRCKFSLVIAGRGDVSYWKRAFGKKRVEFLGEVSYPKVKRLMQRARVVVAPALWPEPCGRTIIEAMALGKAVAGTRHGGTPELVQDGQTGILVPPGDPKRLANALLELLGDGRLRRKLGRRAKKLAQKRFAPKIIAEEHIKFYKEVIGER